MVSRPADRIYAYYAFFRRAVGEVYTVYLGRYVQDSKEKGKEMKKTMQQTCNKAIVEECLSVMGIMAMQDAAESLYICARKLKQHRE